MSNVNCKHWSDCGVTGGGRCALGLYGGRPSHGVCLKVCGEREPATGSKLATIGRVTRRAAHAAGSIARTSAGVGRADQQLYEARLNVCRNCPGGHAVWKSGDVHTCGPMLESMKREGKGTCGCVLRKKAQDAREKCPFGYWRRLT